MEQRWLYKMSVDTGIETKYKSKST